MLQRWPMAVSISNLKLKRYDWSTVKKKAKKTEKLKKDDLKQWLAVVEMNSLEIVILNKLLEFLYVADR